MKTFGRFCKDTRETLKLDNPSYSIRQVALQIGIEPSYLSKVERDLTPPPSEKTIIKLAAQLNVEADMLLAIAGKVSTDLREIIMKRPMLFSELIRSMKDLPDDAVLRLVREVRDGEW